MTTQYVEIINGIVQKIAKFTINSQARDEKTKQIKKNALTEKTNVT